VFEPFQSNFEGGTGLGLAIVYQIVQAHGGKVWARSKPDQGTTFILRFHRLDSRIAVFSGESVPNKARDLAVAAGGGRG
jgi:signal transduction histidine kinase